MRAHARERDTKRETEKFSPLSLSSRWKRETQCQRRRRTLDVDKNRGQLAGQLLQERARERKREREKERKREREKERKRERERDREGKTEREKQKYLGR
jgi:hypothetical protein